jgi:hypothetical protein
MRALDVLEGLPEIILPADPLTPFLLDELQHAELEKDMQDAEGRIAALEERVMEEAEMLNKAALAEMEA